MKLYQVRVTPENITAVRDRIGEDLRACACPGPLASRAMLIFEELFMLIYDHNPDKTVLAECAVTYDGTVRLITKDNGRIADLTDTDRRVSSLRAYTVSSLLEAHTVSRVHFLALSYNRNTLEVK